MAGRPWRLSAKLLVLCSVLAVIGFSAVCASVMFDMRRGEEQLARQSLDNLASSIEADISRNIELYDLSLRAVAAGMLLPEITQVSKSVRQLILFDRAAAAKHFGSIQVFDARGRLTADSSTLDPQSESRADEQYFTVHRDRPEDGLFISRPGLHHGAYAIVLSRRITGADGSFLGVVAGSIRFSYFHELFGRLRLDPDDIIAVLRQDGTVIMRRPFDLDVIGKNLDTVPGVAQALSDGGTGAYSGNGVFDGVPRLIVWRSAAAPLVVLVGKPWGDILSLWRTEALRIGAIMTALAALVLAATLVLAREIRRRGEAEDKLEELATTDALTGLCNRRKFDAVIEVEWRRALRQRTPLSLLMIDADHFKAYNDTFGHQAGDQVLIGIAICISDSITRAADCAARYGGEEFAVLLPEIAAGDALAIAETIRLKVQGWSDEATPSTVSIGITSATPTSGLDWPDFVQAADKALYAAKAAGRNRCMLAETPELPLAA
jgi:diguanylate cyclase (GGDEF)-like protein